MTKEEKIKTSRQNRYKPKIRTLVFFHVFNSHKQYFENVFETFTLATTQNLTQADVAMNTQSIFGSAIKLFS